MAKKKDAKEAKKKVAKVVDENDAKEVEEKDAEEVVPEIDQYVLELDCSIPIISKYAPTVPVMDEKATQSNR